ncbi:MAG: TolC family protein [Marinilabiliaceae bacterium]|nr:TolC family protein [Marinilabiliaceae bacterium]
MTKQFRIALWMMAAMMVLPPLARAQTSAWTLDACIEQAIKANVSVQKARLSVSRSEEYASQAQASRMPSVSASASQNFTWSKQMDAATGEYGAYEGSRSGSYGVNGNVTLFNGFKVSQSIRQSQLTLESSLLDAKALEESVELSVLSAYVQVLYAREQVNNAANQVAATEKQLQLVEERMTLGGVSRSDFLQIKSSLAAEKLSLANAQGNLAMARLNLLQLMELPVDDGFDIASPSVDSLMAGMEIPVAQSIYKQALQQKPQIKSAALQTESAKLDIRMAQADRLPSLSLNAGINSGYSYPTNGFSYADQIQNRLTPSVGLTLSIPIYQKRQIKTSINIAKIGLSDAELTEINTRNTLRKQIEQACQDVVTAREKYLAGVDAYDSGAESHQVAAEKVQQGLMNSVDYLFEKNSLIQAESNLLQAKYNLLFATKILDYYKGIPLTL